MAVLYTSLVCLGRDIIFLQFVVPEGNRIDGRQIPFWRVPHVFVSQRLNTRQPTFLFLRFVLCPPLSPKQCWEAVWGEWGRDVQHEKGGTLVGCSADYRGFPVLVDKRHVC